MCPIPVLVMPNEHYRTDYDIPDELLAAVQVMGKRVALALKATYGCDRTLFPKHNEPAGWPGSVAPRAAVRQRASSRLIAKLNVSRRGTSTPDMEDQACFAFT